MTWFSGALVEQGMNGKNRSEQELGSVKECNGDCGRKETKVCCEGKTDWCERML
jgi:hypothetical protein